MSEPPVLVCPECGVPRAADGTPACACAHRASEAHRESRTAEAAAAEDFDPVRIRPFVEVGEKPADPAGEPELPRGTGDLADVTVVGTDAGQEPVEPPAVVFPAGGAPDRRRRTVLLAGTGAAVAALVTGGFVSGLFTYDPPSRDGSVAGGVRAGVPEAPPSSSGPSVTASSPTASSTQSSAPPSSSPSAQSSDSASPAGAATPTRVPSSAAATATVAPGPTVSSGLPPVLSLGDKGPEVVELQLRLRQVGLYDGEADGDFDEQVQSAVRTYQVTRFVLQDDSGVYGRATRASLESETSEP
ncbi:peptidoglycan-binding domain-containing protein [Streptomyces sviceus]|uniref:peptidoglycan-binding domain-containing protein n=1 Tax=Streptomyces sviceus TaxID=285530 RepID=UPI0036EDE639